MAGASLLEYLEGIRTGAVVNGAPGALQSRDPASAAAEVESHRSPGNWALLQNLLIAALQQCGIIKATWNVVFIRFSEQVVRSQIMVKKIRITDVEELFSLRLFLNRPLSTFLDALAAAYDSRP